jgi:hypothetical protein
MATFDPRRLLIFAVRVLETAWCMHASRSSRSMVIMLVSIPLCAEKKSQTKKRTENEHGN